MPPARYANARWFSRNRDSRRNGDARDAVAENGLIGAYQLGACQVCKFTPTP